MRVAVSQFATSLNAQENLASCIRIINETAKCEPDLIVLPEFCNTLFCNSQAWYVDHNQAWNEALSVSGTFLQCIAEQAKKHNCYIVLGVTLRRDLSRNSLNNEEDGSIKSNISVTTCLFSPLGDLIQQVDKEKLTGQESHYFMSGNKVSEVANTPFGKLGFLIGNDVTTFEASRGLALSGAQLLCHSMNTFALDQSNLHGPTRSCENKVFLAAANKVGSLIPPEDIVREESTTFTSKNSLSPEHYMGSGQSHITSPDGNVLAKITHNKEDFVFADIDLTECNTNNKTRPDGTDIIKQRRPELYQTLTPPMKGNHEDVNKVPATANVAIFATYKSNEQAIEDVCHYIENNLSDIIQLPELFFIDDKVILNNPKQMAEVAYLSEQLINQVSSVLRPFQYVCTSLVIEGMHQAVIIDEHGLFAKQQQLHFCQRYQWTPLGNDINVIELPLEQGIINVAMLTADDVNIPEIVNVAALKGIHVLLVPFDIQEHCEVEYSLLTRATENRICIVAASREKVFSHDFPIKQGHNQNYNNDNMKSQKSTGLIINLTTDSALLSQWKARKFDGYINPAIVKHQHGKITKAVIHPIAACYKLMEIKSLL